MIVKAKLLILGTETIASKKVEGKVYNQVNFVDGNNTCGIITDNAAVFEKASKMDRLSECIAELDIRLGRYTNCKLLAIDPVAAK